MEWTKGSPTAVGQRSPAVGMENAGKDVKAGTLKKACADFESIFIYTMLKTMRSSIPKSGLLDGFAGKDTYTMIMDQKLAEELSRRGDGVGLQKILFRQLSQEK